MLEYLVEGRIRRLLINLFQPEVALQSLSSDRSLLYPQARVALRELRIIQITISAQAFDRLFNDRGCRAAAFKQTLSQLFNRTLPGSQQLAGALKDEPTGFIGIERRRMLSFELPV